MNILSPERVVKKALSETQLLLFFPHRFGDIADQFKVHFKLSIDCFSLIISIFAIQSFCLWLKRQQQQQQPFPPRLPIIKIEKLYISERWQFSASLFLAGWEVFCF